MTLKTKNVLVASINQYCESNEKTKKSLVEMVKRNLNTNQKGLHSIGFGLDEEMVSAAHIFLRIHSKL